MSPGPDFEQQRKRRGLFGRKRQQDDGWKAARPSMAASARSRARPEDSEDVYEDAYAEGPVEGAPEQEFEPVENYDGLRPSTDEFGAAMVLHRGPRLPERGRPARAILSLGDDALICDIWFVARWLRAEPRRQCAFLGGTAAPAAVRSCST